MNPKVLVTGGSGFIGSFLVKKLLERGKEVIVFDRLPYNQAKNLEDLKNNKKLHYFEGDITNKTDVSSVVTQDLEVIYHLSAIVGVSKYISNPLNVIDVNVIGTRNIVEYSSKYKIKVVYTSTSEIYGKNLSIPWSEEDDRVLGSTNIDRWTYSTSKAVGEHLVLAMHKSKNLPVSIVRYFNVYGPRQNPILVVPQTIKKILIGEKPLLYDGGEQTRCFTYVEDAVEATIMVAESKKANGEVYNIGSNKESKIKDVVLKIFQIIGKEVDYIDLDTSKHYGSSYQDIIRRVPDVNKIKEQIDWEISTSIDEGLRKTVEWYSDNILWFD